MQAKRDENFVTTLLGVSNVDGKTPVTIWADPVTHRLLVDMSGGVTYGSGAPSSTPSGLGQTYIDTVGGKVYISVATVNSGSWALLN